MFKRVVVALDGSSLSEQSLPHAVALARASDANLVLLRIIEKTLPGKAVSPPDPLEWEALRIEAPAYLDEVARRLKAQGVASEVVTVEGEPTDQIIAFVRGEPKTLLVICSHGMSGTTGWVLGGVVQKIILHAHVSLLVVRAFGDAPLLVDGINYRRVMGCLDGSQRSECILPTVNALARQRAMQVHFSLVVEDWASRYNLDETDQRLRVLRELDGQRCETLKHYARGLQARYRNEDLEASYRVEYALRPLEKLHEMVREESPDLIVLAAHGTTCSNKWPFGCVALNFLIYGTTPLLVVQDLNPEDIQMTQAEIAGREIRGH